MFLGEFHHSLDEKGRLTLPARFRDALEGGLILTRGFEGCLFVFTKSDWPQIEDQFRSKEMFGKKDARKYARYFLAGASEEALDAQGRIVIPQRLREEALPQKDVVIIGVSNRLEIWGKDRWEEYSRDAEEKFADIAEDLLGL